MAAWKGSSKVGHGMPLRGGGKKLGPHSNVVENRCAKCVKKLFNLVHTVHPPRPPFCKKKRKKMNKVKKKKGQQFYLRNLVFVTPGKLGPHEFLAFLANYLPSSSFYVL